MPGLSEYLSGPEKIRFEAWAGRAALPLLLGSKSLQAYSAHVLGEPGIAQVSRVVGPNSRFEMPKIRLENSAGDKLPGADLMKRVGLDEIAQIEEVRLGRMALVHVRPLDIEDLDTRHFAVSKIDAGLARDWVELRGMVEFNGGITGPFQVPAHEGRDNSFMDQAETEVDYMTSADMHTDLQILRDTAYMAARVLVRASGIGRDK